MLRNVDTILAIRYTAVTATKSATKVSVIVIVFSVVPCFYVLIICAFGKPVNQKPFSNQGQNRAILELRLVDRRLRQSTICFLLRHL